MVRGRRTGCADGETQDGAALSLEDAIELAVSTLRATAGEMGDELPVVSTSGRRLGGALM